MRTFAYCAASVRDSVLQAAGVQPLLSPPVTAETFHPSLLEGYDFIYFKLHGLPNEIYWYGDDWITALRADQILAADLTGTVVFAANCHLANGPMLDALLRAGARAVVGGPGKNYAKKHAVYGADVLGRTFRRLVAAHLSPNTAFRLARLMARTHFRRNHDTLSFQIYRGKQ